jgi:AcrR family transcriptional regulator
MSEAVTSPDSRASYHHGALKETLTAVAEELLATKGASGFTLADAARVAGVSSAAPYRHFADKDALIAAVAARGFRDFGSALSSARTQSAEPLAGFAAMGNAYLAFARNRPGAYAAMFQNPGTKILAPPSDGPQAFEQLVMGLRDALDGRLPPHVDAFQLACQIWALSHGIATLEQASAMTLFNPGQAETLLSAGVTALIRGTVGMPEQD